MCSEIRHCVPGMHMCFYNLCLFAGLPVVKLECELVGFSHFVHTHTRTHPVTQKPHTHKHTQKPTPHHTDTHTYIDPTHPDLHAHICTQHLPLPWLLLGAPPCTCCYNVRHYAVIITYNIRNIIITHTYVHTYMQKPHARYTWCTGYESLISTVYQTER